MASALILSIAFLAIYTAIINSWGYHKGKADALTDDML